MFIGHHATAFALKPIAPRVSLGILFGATILLDLIWPILILLGIEDVRIAPGITAFTPLDFYKYPITHSLLAVFGWSILAAIAYWLFRKFVRDAAIVGAVVLSHWVVDFIAHRPDLSLWPGGPKVGLGLWDSIPGTIVVEVALFIAGLAQWLFVPWGFWIDRHREAHA